MAELEIHVKRPVFSKNGNLVGILEVKVWKVPRDKCYPEGYKYPLVSPYTTKRAEPLTETSSDTTTTDAKDTTNT